MTRRRVPPAAFAARPFALLPALLAAQDPDAPPPPLTLPALLQQVQQRDLAPDLITPLADEILAHGPAAALQLHDVVRALLAERRKAFAKDLEAHARAAQKQAAALLHKQQGRGNDAKVADLRKRALAVTQAHDLTKERIHAEFDPLVQELAPRCTVALPALLEQDAALQKRDQELHRAATSLACFWDVYLRAIHAADEAPDGQRHLDRIAQLPEPDDLAARLDGELELALLLAACETPRDVKALQHNAELRTQLDAEDCAGVLQLNRLRLLLGLPLLAIDPALCMAARGHADDMKRLGFFSHESPVPGKRTPGDRAALAGTSASAENIAAGQSKGVDAIGAWYYSPGHHKNMFGGHARVGLGHSDTLWTQMFGD